MRVRQAAMTCISTLLQGLFNRVLRDSPESRKIPFVPSRGTNGIVPKIFRDGTNGIGTIQNFSGRDKQDRDNIEKNQCPEFFSSVCENMSYTLTLFFISNKYINI